MTNEFDFIDNPFILDWFVKMSEQNPLKISFLLRGNVNIFADFWGKENGKVKDFDYWKKEHSGIVIFIYSNNKQTIYKVQYLGEKENFIKDQLMAGYLIDFIQMMLKEFSKEGE